MASLICQDTKYEFGLDDKGVIHVIDEAEAKRYPLVQNCHGGACILHSLTDPNPRSCVGVALSDCFRSTHQTLLECAPSRSSQQSHSIGVCVAWM